LSGVNRSVPTLTRARDDRVPAARTLPRCDKLLFDDARLFRALFAAHPDALIIAVPKG
jgi:hypothetical protein